MKVYIKTLVISKGFTLIELLVVISIIGLLSSVVLTSLSSARTKAKSSVYKSELITLRPHLSAICEDRNIVAGDAPSTSVHGAGTVGTMSCGPGLNGTFSVTFGAALNGGACTGATITNTSVAFNGC